MSDETYGDERNVDCPACGRNICIQDLTTDGCLEVARKEVEIGQRQTLMSLIQPTQGLAGEGT